jgi:hypothetical protein
MRKGLCLNLLGTLAAVAFMSTGALAAGGTSSGAPARAGSSFLSRSGGRAPSAPCTKPALTAGLRRGKLHGSIDGHGFGCAGRFAFAAVLVGSGNEAVEITVLFRADAGRWQVASRAKYCENGSVPAKIRRPACETN